MINSFSPMTVSSRAGIEDTTEQILSRWARFDLLPNDKQEVLISIEAETVIQDFGQQNRLNSEQVAELARIVRDLFFGAISENGVAGEIIKRIPVIDTRNAQSVALEIISKIYKAKPTPEPISSQGISQSNVVELKPKYEQIELSGALKKYPKIQFQLLTSRPLTLIDYPEPAQPNVVNWIKDYQQKLGFEPHTTINRANYIFHSDNGKRLSEQDRNKLMYILKSVDDKKLIQVDAKIQQIVFPKNLGEIFNEETTVDTSSVSQVSENLMQFHPGQTQFRIRQAVSVAPQQQVSVPSQLPPRQVSIKPFMTHQDELDVLRREALSESLVPEQQGKTVAPSLPLQTRNQGALENIYSQRKVENVIPQAPELNLNEFTVGRPAQKTSSNDVSNISFSSPQKLPYENE